MLNMGTFEVKCECGITIHVPFMGEIKLPPKGKEAEVMDLEMRYAYWDSQPLTIGVLNHKAIIHHNYEAIMGKPKPPTEYEVTCSKCGRVISQPKIDEIKES